MRQGRTPGGTSGRGPAGSGRGSASGGRSGANPARSNTTRSGTAKGLGRLSSASGPGAGRPARRPAGAAPATRRDSGTGPAGNSAGGSGGGSAKRTRAPEPRRFTGRALVLAVVMLGLLLAYAYPARVYLAQQAEIAALEERQRTQLARISELQERNAKWDDQQYVISQARERLHMVFPGETPYVVIDPSGPQLRPSNPQPAAPEANRDVPWYGKLWSSIESADRR